MCGRNEKGGPIYSQRGVAGGLSTKPLMTLPPNPLAAGVATIAIGATPRPYLQILNLQIDPCHEWVWRQGCSLWNRV
jgi:hypothetical protein